MNVPGPDISSAGHAGGLRYAWSATIEAWLLNLLGRHGVRVELIDPWTLRLEAVRVGQEFSKARTNLLARRTGPEHGAFVYVDSDLAYRGAERALATALTGPCHRNWRRLRTARLPGTVGDVLHWALKFLGSPLEPELGRHVKAAGREPLGLSGPEPTVAAADGVVTREMAAHAFESSFRKELARDLAVLTTRPTLPRSALVWARPGSGKDHLLLAAAHVLLETRAADQIHRVSAARVAAGCMFAPELDSVLMQLLDEATAHEGLVVLVPDLDLLVSGSPVSHGLLCDALDRGLRLLATVRSEASLERLRSDEAVARRVVALHLAPAEDAETATSLEGLAATSPIEVAPQAVQVAVHRTSRQHAAQPAGALGLLGAALAEARWHQSSHIGPDDVFAAFPNQWPETAGKE